MKRKGNPNAAGTETAVNKLISETLDKIIEGAKTASEAIGDAGDPIANIAVNGVGAKAEETSVKSLSEGIGKIINVVLKDIRNADVGTDKKADGLTERGANAGDVGKLFGNAADNGAVTAGSAKKAGADASKAVGAVTGTAILQAIIKDGDAAKLATNNPTANTDVNSPKDGTVAGGIALRAMAKNGKFANASAADIDYATAVKGAAVSAVTKALDTLTIAIRKTIDAGLKTVKEAIKINANYTSYKP
ncbi:VlpC87 (plasmid) [Borrelia hermsii HS1]|uniref:Variable large protein n=1 Tax=Borrelia hermsii HS1 TaxID=1867252 RepID=A0ABN4NYD8_BORHE|nr:VlpC87 [Borrelia hermsii HS1]